jgi:hypothetical protein
LKKIDDWLASQAAANMGNLLALVAQRAKRINEEVYENFTNQRGNDYKEDRDVNSIRMKCRAGRGRMFGSVPRASKSGTVKQDDSDWIYDTHTVGVHNNLEGSHDVTVLPDNSGCDFKVRCKGVAFEDTTRGHGAYDAELHVTFKMTEDAMSDAVQIERIALQRELGL